MVEHVKVLNIIKDNSKGDLDREMIKFNTKTNLCSLINGFKYGNLLRVNDNLKYDLINKT